MRSMKASTPKLLPFQLEAVSKAKTVKRMLINLPAGSGKTLVALNVAKENNCKRVLVVCPAFLKLNWQYELMKWYPEVWEPCIINTVKDTTKLLGDRTFAIVGYSFFQTWKPKGNKSKDVKSTELISDKAWDLVICDESHYLRRWEANRCKEVILKVCKGRDRLLFLTATPLVSSAADLHPTASIMQPGEWKRFWEFQMRYCDRARDVFVPGGWRYFGVNPKYKLELKERLKAFTYSAKKERVLAELPPKRIIELPVHVGKCRKFESVEAMLSRIIESGIEEETVKTERESIGKKKIKHVLELLETFEPDEPVVIFAWHRSVVQELTTELSDAKEKVAMILGGMNETNRMEKVIDFTEGRINKLVVSIAAGGLGLNLQRASIGVFAELPYSHAEFMQASDRIHRIGSVKKVRIYKLIGVNSLDEHINKIMESKHAAAEEVGVCTA